MTTIAELRALHEAATPGPWAIEDIEGEGLSILEPDENFLLANLVYEGGWSGSDTDLRLIVAMRNALPDLLACIEAAQAFREAPAYDSNKVLQDRLWPALDKLEGEA